MIKLVSGFIVLALLILVYFCSRYDPGIKAAQNHSSKNDVDCSEKDAAATSLADVEDPAPTPSEVKCWECQPHDDDLTVDTSFDDSESNKEELPHRHGGSSTLWQSIRNSLKQRRSTLKMGNIHRRSILERSRRHSTSSGELSDRDIII